MKIKKCPRCKTANLVLWLGGVMGIYYCKKCQYKGPLVIEEEIKKEDLLKILDEDTKIN